MTTTFRRLLPLFMVTALAIAFGGCDDPNDPDIPLRPYTLAGQYVTAGRATDVDAGGNYAAVAQESFGAIVFDVSNPTDPQPIFRYIPDPGKICANVALDPLHHYLAVFSPDNLFWGQSVPIFDFLAEDTTGDYVSPAWVRFSAGFSGPLTDVRMTSSPDTVWFWASDRTPTDGFAVTRMCWNSDSARWELCSPDWESYTTQRGSMHGFDLRSDGYAAVAIEDAGLHIQRIAPVFERLSDLDTPGMAYDCAWYGNYIIVADQYQVLVVDATDVMHPSILSQLRIPNADRLRRIVMDGSYACVLDENDGIYIVDVSTPAAPAYVQLLELLDPTGLAAANNRLFVTDEGNGLVIYTR